MRPALLALLVATAILYVWDLGASGWANSFYSAAVEAGTKSWKAFLFGSFDSSNFITVDKPPAALWVMELSARIFGLNAWSVLVPQALEGVAAVGVLYLAVRRALSPAAGLIAGVALALTPVAALMFRFNNPDALLVLLLVGAAYATTRYLDGGRARWMLAAGALIGLGFITKSLQAFIVLPMLAAVVAFLGGRPLLRRIRDLLLGGLGLLVAGGWWVATVELTPASARPYIGGSQNNNLLNLIFGYNGFGRLTGNETGSVTGGAGGGGGGMWGPTGITRLFNSSFGGQISWLLPAALLLLVGGLIVTAKAVRTDSTRGGLVLWGGWLVVTGLVFSFSKGIIHPYYTVALAPAIAAIVGIGAVLLWSRRGSCVARSILAAAVEGTALWAWVLLDRSPSWHPWLRVVVVVAGTVAAVALVVVADLWSRFERREARWLSRGVAAVAIAACLGAPLASTLSTVATPHSGAIPSAGPTVAAGFGGGPGGGALRGGRSFPAGVTRRGAAGSLPSGRSGRSGGLGGRPGSFPGLGRAGGQGLGGGGGPRGILGSGTVSAVKALLQKDAGGYTWVAATTGSESAAAYQLATRDPVMSIGGFNGTDPAPTLAQFERYVTAGRIHWDIGGQSVQGNGGSSDAAKISVWVKAHFAARTVDGVTLYDLTARTAV